MAAQVPAKDVATITPLKPAGPGQPFTPLVLATTALFGRNHRVTTTTILIEVVAHASMLSRGHAMPI